MSLDEERSKKSVKHGSSSPTGFKRMESNSSSRDKKQKALRFIANGDFKPFMRIDFDQSGSSDSNIPCEDEEEKNGSKLKAYFKHFFRTFKSKEAAEEQFFLKKLFTRYDLAIRTAVSVSVFLSIFNLAVYWLERGPENTIAEGFFKLFYFILIGSIYLLIMTNRSRQKYKYFRIFIMIMIFGGFLLKLLEIEYIIFAKGEKGDL